LEGKVKVAGVGRVKRTVFDVYGVTRIIKTRAYFIPEGNIRLFSPQTYFQENERGAGETTSRGIKLTMSDGTKLTFPYNNQSNIPLMLTRGQTTVGLTQYDVEFLSQPHNVSTYLSVAEEVNQNIAAAQKELLKWHWRLGNAGLRWIQWLAATPRTTPDGNDAPIIQVKHEKMSSCNLCAACQVAKQARRGPEM
jgi:hypothetical protein